MSEFAKKMIEKAKSNPKRLILPEGIDPRVLKAAQIIIEQKIASEVIVLGDPKELKKIADAEGVNLDQITVIDFMNDSRLQEFANQYYEQRKHKGLSVEKALQGMSDDVFFGAKMLSQGFADAMVSGSFSPTSKTLRASLLFAGLMPGIKTLAGNFIMEVQNKELGHQGCFIFGDCAVTPNPDPEQLADIAMGAAVGAKTLLNAEPKVALLSFSTKGSASTAETEKVVAAYDILKERNVDFAFDGELQLDAAIDKETAILKAPESPVAGEANVLIFPSLEAGNIGYKLVHRFSQGANAHGPILQGLAKPINDLSRGCSVEDIVSVSAITLVQSMA